MNMLSTHAYNISVKAKSLPNCTLSRSQMFELIAAYFGQQSYAALKNAADPSKLDKPNPEEAYQRCIQTAVTLKQTGEIAATLANIVVSELDAFNKLNVQLINRQALRYLALMQEEESNGTIEINSLYMEFEGIKVHVCSMLETLASASNKGDKESKLLAFLVVACNYSIAGSVAGSEHWYKRQLAGEVLGYDQKQWADNYLKRLLAKQALEDFLENISISDLAFPDIENILNAKDYSQVKQSICYQLGANEIKWRIDHIWKVFKNNETKNKVEFLSQWDRLFAFQEPQRDSLAQLAESETDPVKQHAWLKFAKANDIDLERDEMYLINSYTGDVWEHDFDGPVEAAGYESISLPPLPPELKQQVSERVEAMLKLQEIIQKL